MCGNECKKRPWLIIRIQILTLFFVQVTALRNLGIDVLELPPEESNALSVYTQVMEHSYSYGGVARNKRKGGQI